MLVFYSLFNLIIWYKDNEGASSKSKIASVKTVKVTSSLRDLKESSNKHLEEQNNLRANFTYKLIDINEIRYHVDVNFVIRLFFYLKYE